MRRTKEAMIGAVCPGCGRDLAEPAGIKSGYTLYKCRGCKSLYCRPGPATLDYAGYYDSAITDLPDVVQLRLAQIAGTFEPHRQLNRLLDVGFGAGGMVRAALATGWNVWGVETAKTPFIDAPPGRFQPFSGDLTEARYPSGFFDVAVLAEVIEHLPEPLLLLEEIARVLRPGGLCWATTPNAVGIAARVLGVRWSVVAPPEHVQLLTPAGARALFKRAGFSTVRLQSRGLNPLELARFPSTIRQAATEPSADDIHSRVEAGFRLNSFFLGAPLRRRAKEASNAILGLTGMGDSLSIRATT